MQPSAKDGASCVTVWTSPCGDWRCVCWQHFMVCEVLGEGKGMVGEPLKPSSSLRGARHCTSQLSLPELQAGACVVI